MARRRQHKRAQEVRQQRRLIQADEEENGSLGESSRGNLAKANRRRDALWPLPCQRDGPDGEEEGQSDDLDGDGAVPGVDGGGAELACRAHAQTSMKSLVELTP